MRRLFGILIILVAIGVSVQAQSKTDSREEKKEARQAEKKAKKKEKKQQEKETIMKINSLLVSKTWVLEAVTVRGQRGGQLLNVNPTLNFLSVNGDEEAIIQLSFSNLPGWNGVGGVTIKGTPRRYEIIPGKKPGKPSKLRATITGPGGTADIFLTVGAYNSSVQVRGNWGNEVNLMGQIKHPNESNVYQGVTLFGN